MRTPGESPKHSLQSKQQAHELVTSRSLFLKLSFFAALVLYTAGLQGHNAPRYQASRFQVTFGTVPASGSSSPLPPSGASSPPPLPSPAGPAPNPYYNPEGIVDPVNSTSPADNTSAPDQLSGIMEQCEILESSLHGARLNLVYSMADDQELVNNPRAASYAQAWRIILTEREERLLASMRQLIERICPQAAKQRQLLSSLALPDIPNNLQSIDRITFMESYTRTCRVGIVLCDLLSSSASTKSDYNSKRSSFRSNLLVGSQFILEDTARVMPYRKPEDPTNHMTY